MAADIVMATFSPTTYVCRLVVPAWVSNPTAMPRTDGRDELTIEVTRRFPQERWEILPGTEDAGILYAFVLLGKGVKQQIEEAVQMKVLVPPAIFADFTVVPYAPE